MKPEMTKAEKLAFQFAIFKARWATLNSEATKTAGAIFNFAEAMKGRQLDSDKKVDEGIE